MKIKWWQIALVVSLLVALSSPLASSAPDGLEKVAAEKGFIILAQEAPFTVIADYVFPGIENEAAATILAGLIGTLILFGMVYGLAWLVKSKRTEPTQNSFQAGDSRET